VAADRPQQIVKEKWRDVVAFLKPMLAKARKAREGRGAQAAE
jgi:hypothetical protein